LNDKQLDHHLSKHKLGGSHSLPLYFLLHDLAIPANVGGMFRLADAFGVSKIFLTGKTVVPPNDKMRRASRSTLKTVNYDVVESPYEVISELKRSGCRVVVLEITNQSSDIRELTLNSDDSVCLIFGSEKDGVHQDLIELADDVVHIPMFGENSSMSVIHAAAIAAFEMVRVLDVAPAYC